MPLTKLVRFDRPLSGALIPGHSVRVYTDTEVEALRREAFRQGQDAGQAFAQRQMVEIRADVQQLQDGIFGKLVDLEPVLLGQIRSALPDLALDLARRLMAGFEPTPEIIERICGEALDQLLPERENLELILSPRDARLLEELNPAWLQRYPGLKVRADTALATGDCQVRSRFGLTDARRVTKLETLSLGLASS
jgi:flagellar assembly protein FliH